MIDTGMSHMGFRCIVRAANEPEEDVSHAKAHGNDAQGSTVQKLNASIKLFFTQFRIIRRALVHPRVPWHAKAVAGCAALYIVSPLQLIPNFIPVIGQMDDILVVTLGLKYLRRYVPKDVLDECENGPRHTQVKKIVKTRSDPLQAS
jgi:uncharacterized membrane protein YkvA (DUF1232 family)